MIYLLVIVLRHISHKITSKTVLSYLSPTDPWPTYVAYWRTGTFGSQSENHCVTQWICMTVCFWVIFSGHFKNSFVSAFWFFFFFFFFYNKNSISYEGFDLEKCLKMKEFHVNLKKLQQSWPNIFKDYEIYF